LPCGLFGAGLVTCTGLFWLPDLKSFLFPEGFDDEGLLSDAEGRVTVVLGFLSFPEDGRAAGLAGTEGLVAVALFFLLSFGFRFCEAGVDLLTCDEADDDRVCEDEERDAD
jgi:hypothetical protein